MDSEIELSVVIFVAICPSLYMQCQQLIVKDGPFCRKIADLFCHRG